MSVADTFIRAGKVRDLYAVGADRLLLVASDRLSAFDVVLPTAIPDKGRVLTALSRYWFRQTRDTIPNHLVGWNPDDLPAGVVPDDVAADLRGRMMLCRRAEVLPIEIVIRGYLSGSGWKDYQSTGEVSGLALPAGLREGDRLPAPILTPATKAPAGSHDENIDFGTMVGALERIAIRDGGVGSARDLAHRVRDVALELYRRAAARCESVGLILADTKFEMGLAGGELILIDEILTPASS